MAAKRWRGKWVSDFTLHGKRIRRVSPVQTKAGAQRYEAELRLASSTSIACSGPSPRLDDFEVRWLTERVLMRNKPSDRVRKESVLRLHLLPALGAKPLDGITPHDFDRYTADKLDSVGHRARATVICGCCRRSCVAPSSGVSWPVRRRSIR